MLRKRRQHPETDIVAQCDREVEPYRSINDFTLQKYFLLYESNKENYTAINNENSSLEQLVDAASALEMTKMNILDRAKHLLDRDERPSFSVDYSHYYNKPLRMDPLFDDYDPEIDKIRALNDRKLQEAIVNYDKCKLTYVSKINELKSALSNVDTVELTKVRADLVLAGDEVKEIAKKIGVGVVETKLTK